MAGLDELRASRARLADAHADDRRRFERALHDGVQQDLVALAVRLQLLGERIARGEPGADELLAEIRTDVHAALDRSRRLADEMYPSLLDAQGLSAALHGLPARVQARGIGRHRRQLEAAVYFACRAALAEASAASAVGIDLTESGGTLRLELAGVEPTEPLRDVVGAAGGSLGPGPGGVVVATFPI